MKDNGLIILAIVTASLLFFSASKPLSAQSLFMGQSTFERVNQAPFTHRFAITIINSSPNVTRFNASCEYQCPAGTITKAGFDIVQGGYLKGNSEFTYTGMFRFQCRPVAPEIQLLCPIRYADGSSTGSYAIRFRP